MVDEQTVTELVVGRLRRGGAVVYVVRTGSMAPLVRPGDHVVISPAPQRYRVGDLTLRPAVPYPVVHRVIALVDEGATVWLCTKGDAAPHADPLQPASVFAGVVCTVRHNGRTLALASLAGRTLGGAAAQLSAWQARSAGGSQLQRAWRRTLQSAVHLIDCLLWWFAR